MAVPVSLCRGKWLLSSIVLIPLQAADKGSRKRYEPADKERPTSPPAKRANLSPDRGEASSSPGPAGQQLERSTAVIPKPQSEIATRQSGVLTILLQKHSRAEALGRAVPALPPCPRGTLCPV